MLRQHHLTSLEETASSHIHLLANPTPKNLRDLFEAYDRKYPVQGLIVQGTRFQRTMGEIWSARNRIDRLRVRRARMESQPQIQCRHQMRVRQPRQLEQDHQNHLPRPRFPHLLGRVIKLSVRRNNKEKLTTSPTHPHQVTDRSQSTVSNPRNRSS